MKKNFMCFIHVYFWNRKMDNPVFTVTSNRNLVIHWIFHVNYIIGRVTDVGGRGQVAVSGILKILSI